jgi:DNA ligase-4
LEAFNTYSDLKKVIDMFKDPNATLATMDIQMGCPFRPMLSKRVKPHQVLSCMNKEPFYMEIKLDGERVLMHKNGDQFRWFSRYYQLFINDIRNAIDYTDLYGASKLEGALTPYINDCFGKHASSLILDGEMLVYNYKTNEIQPFGELKKACVDSKTNGQDAELRPFYVVFDCLHVNGISMANMPLSKRKVILKQVFIPKEHRIEVIETHEGHSQQDVLQFLDQMILNKKEGLIVKNPNAPYLPADRSNAWLKIKADYIDYLAEPFDVVIIGGFYGGGRRQGILASFMYGIIDDRHSDGLRIISFGKLGSGFTDEQLEQLNGSEDDWFEYQPSRKPSWFIHEDSAEKPDVLIDPERAPIIAMACTEVVPSTQYATGCAPRFPTMKDIREDKSLKDCMTFTQLQDFMKETAGKMYTKRLHEEEYHENELTKTPKKKRKVNSVPVTPVRTFSLTSNNSGQLFSGMSFYLVPGAVNKSCEDLITQHGGLLVGNPVKGKTSLVVADKTSKLPIINF